MTDPLPSPRPAGGRTWEWQVVEARELLGDLSRRGISSVIPERPGVYVWARSYRAPVAALTSPSAFKNWVLQELSTPIGRIGPINLRHLGSIQELTLGGQATSEDKLETLEWVSKSPKLRRIVIDLAEGCGGFGPTLYVGEASNLALRVFQHLAGVTDFASRLDEQLKVDPSSLLLRFAIIPASPNPEDNRPKAFRTLLEDFVTRSTLGSLVDRIG
jgi:hypothetical protein